MAMNTLRCVIYSLTHRSFSCRAICISIRRQIVAVHLKSNTHCLRLSASFEFAMRGLGKSQFAWDCVERSCSMLECDLPQSSNIFSIFSCFEMDVSTRDTKEYPLQHPECAIVCHSNPTGTISYRLS